MTPVLSPNPANQAIRGSTLGVRRHKIDDTAFVAVRPPHPGRPARPAVGRRLKVRNIRRPIPPSPACGRSDSAGESGIQPVGPVRRYITPRGPGSDASLALVKLKSRALIGGMIHRAPALPLSLELTRSGRPSISRC